MSDRHERIVDLLQRRSDLAAAGRPVDAAELCRDAPELLEDVQRSLRLVEAVERAEVPAARSQETPSPDTYATLHASPAPAATGGAPQVPHYQVLGLLGVG